MTLQQSSSSATSLSPPEVSQSPASTYLSTIVPPDPQTSCSLFRLPGEIRERIYHYALSSSRLVQWPVEEARLSIAVPLILTCRAIYQEACPVLYASNRFLFMHPSDLNMFVNIGSRHYARKHIEDVYLRIRDRDVRLWTGYLGSTTVHRSRLHDCPNLKNLHIWFRGSQWPFASPAEGMERWSSDPALESLCGAMQEKAPTDVKVQVICVHRVTKRDLQLMLAGQGLSHDEVLRKKSNGDVRTTFRKVHGMDVCLELTPFVTPVVGDGSTHPEHAQVPQQHLQEAMEI